MALNVDIELANEFKDTFDIDMNYETLGERRKIILDKLLKCYAEEIV